MFAGRSLTSLQLEIAPLDTGDEEFTSLPEALADGLGRLFEGASAEAGLATKRRG